MYGKKLVAAVLFLTLEEVAADYYGYGNEVTTEAAPVPDYSDFETAPVPSTDFAEGDDGTTVEWPTDFDGWDFSSALLHLDAIDQEAIEQWAETVADKYKDYIPTDYVLQGEISHNKSGTDFEFGVGLALDSWSEGQLAYMDTSSGEPVFATYFYDVAKADSANMSYKPEYLSNDPQTDPQGHGNTWGQSYDADTGSWCIWSYNDDSTTDQWESGTYHFYYTEATTATGYYTGFTQDIEITAYDGATQLLAATTTATLFFALI